MMKNKMTCDEMKVKIMALLDDELSEQDITIVKEHLQSCKQCSGEYASLKNLKEVTSSMKIKKLPEYYWDDYWTHVYNRIERGISWLLISLGVIIVLTFASWEAVTALIADQEMNPLLKGGIFVLVVGVIILIVSILREKILVKRIDKYREVKR
jgi:predicted anti-sigma-YlaC factor YlaD